MMGIYCLIINIKKDINLKIGALGIIQFKKGKYTYVGSAQNNLQKRIERHLSSNKKIRWHIDYLLADPDAEIVKVFYREAGKQEECRTAQIFSKSGKGIKGFGCSDCHCYSHLFRIESNKLSGWKNYNGLQMD